MISSNGSGNNNGSPHSVAQPSTQGSPPAFGGVGQAFSTAGQPVYTPGRARMAAQRQFDYQQNPFEPPTADVYSEFAQHFNQDFMSIQARVNAFRLGSSASNPTFAGAVENVANIVANMGSDDYQFNPLDPAEASVIPTITRMAQSPAAQNYMAYAAMRATQMAQTEPDEVEQSGNFFGLPSLDDRAASYEYVAGSIGNRLGLAGELPQMPFTHALALRIAAAHAERIRAERADTPMHTAASYMASARRITDQLSQDYSLPDSVYFTEEGAAAMPAEPLADMAQYIRNDVQRRINAPSPHEIGGNISRSEHQRLERERVLTPNSPFGSPPPRPQVVPPSGGGAYASGSFNPSYFGGGGGGGGGGSGGGTPPGDGTPPGSNPPSGGDLSLTELTNAIVTAIATGFNQTNQSATTERQMSAGQARKQLLQTAYGDIAGQRVAGIEQHRPLSQAQFNAAIEQARLQGLTPAEEQEITEALQPGLYKTESAAQARAEKQATRIMERKLAPRNVRFFERSRSPSMDQYQRTEIGDFVMGPDGEPLLREGVGGGLFGRGLGLVEGLRGTAAFEGDFDEVKSANRAGLLTGKVLDFLGVKPLGIIGAGLLSASYIPAVAGSAFAGGIPVLGMGLGAMGLAAATGLSGRQAFDMGLGASAAYGIGTALGATPGGAAAMAFGALLTGKDLRGVVGQLGGSVVSGAMGIGSAANFISAVGAVPGAGPVVANALTVLRDTAGQVHSLELPAVQFEYAAQRNTRLNAFYGEHDAAPLVQELGRRIGVAPDKAMQSLVGVAQAVGYDSPFARKGSIVGQIGMLTTQGYDPVRLANMQATADLYSGGPRFDMSTNAANVVGLVGQFEAADVALPRGSVGGSQGDILARRSLNQVMALTEATLNYTQQRQAAGFRPLEAATAATQIRAAGQGNEMLAVNLLSKNQQFVAGAAQAGLQPLSQAADQVLFAYAMQRTGGDPSASFEMVRNMSGGAVMGAMGAMGLSPYTRKLYLQAKSFSRTEQGVIGDMHSRKRQAALSPAVDKEQERSDFETATASQSDTAQPSASPSRALGVSRAVTRDARGAVQAVFGDTAVDADGKDTAQRTRADVLDRLNTLIEANVKYQQQLIREGLTSLDVQKLTAAVSLVNDGIRNLVAPMLVKIADEGTMTSNAVLGTSTPSKQTAPVD